MKNEVGDYLGQKTPLYHEDIWDDAYLKIDTLCIDFKNYLQKPVSFKDHCVSVYQKMFK